MAAAAVAAAAAPSPVLSSVQQLACRVLQPPPIIKVLLMGKSILHSLQQSPEKGQPQVTASWQLLLQRKHLLREQLAGRLAGWLAATTVTPGCAGCSSVTTCKDLAAAAAARRGPSRHDGFLAGLWRLPPLRCKCMQPGQAGGRGRAGRKGAPPQASALLSPDAYQALLPSQGIWLSSPAPLPS